MIKRTVHKSIITCICFLLLMINVTSCALQEVTSVDKGNVSTGESTQLVDITFEGGTGKAHIKSPVEVTEKSGHMTAKFVWSSKNYDYMIVNGIRYDNENEGGESTFTVDIDNITEPLTVTGDTVAMSTPHEIEYVITWGKSEDLPDDASDTANVGTEDTKALETALEDVLAGAGRPPAKSCELRYATGFSIKSYGDYDCINIPNSGCYLLIPEGGDVPAEIPDGVVIIHKPVNRTYLVSTSAMDLIAACSALDRIRLSGTKESDWYIDAAVDAMKKGDILYAGKYRAPDYELILEEGCDLAIENTMIYHEPAVKSKLEELNIPVLVETSSYEEHPLGRLEWIKLYGVLFDKEAEADDFFDEQIRIMEPMLKGDPDTGRTVAFFHVTANGLINVRKPGDYITKMIGIAGGHYVPDITDGEDENALSTMNMQMEVFYEAASSSDVMIYNSTIGGEIASIDELVAKNALFADFKAVKNREVYCTKRDLFQKTTGSAEFMKDLNAVFTGADRKLVYLNRLD